MFAPIGHVMRAKIFNVKGKSTSGSENGVPQCVGYVTLERVEEADLAVLRLHKSTFKGAVIAVSKVRRVAVALRARARCREEGLDVCVVAV